MANWVDVCERSALSQDEPKVCVRVADRPLVACLDGDDVRVVADECPHAGLPLGGGDLTGRVITCPYHGYAFDVRSGRNIDYADDEPLTTFPVRIEGDKVQADLEGAEG
ncbi:MAG: Rieske 2Fe-2S domain-containing protein [Planctomycetota bacterium]